MRIIFYSHASKAHFRKKVLYLLWNVRVEMACYSVNETKHSHRTKCNVVLH